MKISLTYLGTRNSKFRLNLTQRVTGSLVIYKRHEENKSKIGQERSSMQQADYQRHRPTP